MVRRFNYHFVSAVWRVKAVFLILITLLMAGAAVLTFIEDMPFEDALYFALVTGLTIGYGDIVATTSLGKLMSVMIGFIGILFTGLMVAVLVFAVSESLHESRKSG